ncbi:unnamed protein product, partial [Laminaria digitata]
CSVIDEGVPLRRLSIASLFLEKTTFTSLGNIFLHCSRSVYVRCLGVSVFFSVFHCQALILIKQGRRRGRKTTARLKRKLSVCVFAGVTFFSVFFLYFSR